MKQDLIHWNNLGLSKPHFAARNLDVILRRRRKLLTSQETRNVYLPVACTGCLCPQPVMAASEEHRRCARQNWNIQHQLIFTVWRLIMTGGNHTISWVASGILIAP